VSGDLVNALTRLLAGPAAAAVDHRVSRGKTANFQPIRPPGDRQTTWWS
jgi:hypothetical protein